ncbi:MAG: hypothetical protein M3N46_03415 [Actinomycetota bacterium]|nr:hypothetical protein [Actinomycetota bacterium]
MASYTSILDLSCVVLEESWVLGVEARPSSLVIKLDFVITIDHPLYRNPLPTETYPIVRGSLSFEGVETLEWIGQGSPPVVDLDGELVYGNVDLMSVEQDDFVLEGDFGTIRVTARDVQVDYDARG